MSSSSNSTNLAKSKSALSPLIEETELESPLKIPKNKINVGGLSLSKGDKTPHLSRSISASDMNTPKVGSPLSKQLHMQITTSMLKL